MKTLPSMPAQEAFPLEFVEMSDDLGRYSEVAVKCGQIAARFPPARFRRVLDMCCGVGHFAHGLAELGYDVLGVDLSAPQVEVARRRATGARFVPGDMRDPPPGPFDLVVNTYSSFGYMDSVAEDEAVLARWNAVLAPGGALLMELSDLGRAERSFGYPNARVERTNGAVTEELTMDWEAQVLRVRYAKGDFAYVARTRIYSDSQLAGMAERAGFVDIELAGSFAGAPKRPEDRLVLTARKPNQERKP